MRIRAGQLRHRVDLQRATVTVSGQRAPANTWKTLETVWARVEPLTGREQLLAQQADARQTHRITIRYRDGLTTRDRVRFGTRGFNILSIANDEERNRLLVLMCEERV